MAARTKPVITNFSMTFERNVDKDTYKLTYSSGNYSLIFPNLTDEYCERKCGIKVKQLAPEHIRMIKEKLCWYEEIKTIDVHQIYLSNDEKLKFEKHVGFNTILIQEVDNPSNNIVITEGDIRDLKKLTVKKMLEYKANVSNKDQSVPLQKHSGVMN